MQVLEDREAEHEIELRGLVGQFVDTALQRCVRPRDIFEPTRLVLLIKIKVSPLARR
jgi:hypothetical protein